MEGWAARQLEDSFPEGYCSVRAQHMLQRGFLLFVGRLEGKGLTAESGRSICVLYKALLGRGGGELCAAVSLVKAVFLLS